jgi:hypothetical protein
MQVVLPLGIKVLQTTLFVLKGGPAIGILYICIQRDMKEFNEGHIQCMQQLISS